MKCWGKNAVGFTVSCYGPYQNQSTTWCIPTNFWTWRKIRLITSSLTSLSFSLLCCLSPFAGWRDELTICAVDRFWELVDFSACSVDLLNEVSCSIGTLFVISSSLLTTVYAWSNVTFGDPLIRHREKHKLSRYTPYEFYSSVYSDVNVASWCGRYSLITLTCQDSKQKVLL